MRLRFAYCYHVSENSPSPQVQPGRKPSTRVHPVLASWVGRVTCTLRCGQQRIRRACSSFHHPKSPLRSKAYRQAYGGTSPLGDRFPASYNTPNWYLTRSIAAKRVFPPGKFPASSDNLSIHVCEHTGLKRCESKPVCLCADAEKDAQVLPTSEDDDDDDGANMRKRRSKGIRNAKKKTKRMSRADRKRKSKTVAAAAVTAVNFQPPPKNKEREREVHRQTLPPSASPCSSSTTTTSSAAPSVASGTNMSSTKRFGPPGVSPAPRSEGIGREADNGGVGGGEGETDEAGKVARAKAMVPMRPEEYAAQQRTVREVRGRGSGGCIHLGDPQGRSIYVFWSSLNMVGQSHRISSQHTWSSVPGLHHGSF